ncbi:MAG: glycosyltransferase family 9 protein [bacterium]
MNKPERILIIHLDAIGDVLRSTPLIAALRRHLPEAYLGYLTESRCATLLEGNKALNRVFVLHRKRFKKKVREGRSPFLKILKEELYALVRQLRQESFDLVVNLHYSEISAIIAYLVGAKLVLGMALNKWGNYVVHGRDAREVYNTIYQPQELRQQNRQHLVDLYLKVVRPLGVQTYQSKLEVPLRDEDMEFATDFTASQGISENELLIGFQPGAGWAAKRWLPERFARLGDLAVNKYGARILITGAREEADTVVAEVVKRMETKPVISTDQTDLRRVGALIKKCRLFVSTDSGPMHISAAVNTPTIGLFGGTFPFESRPYGKGHLVIVEERMDKIELEEVARALDIQLRLTGYLPNTLTDQELAYLKDHSRQRGILLFA